MGDSSSVSLPTFPLHLASLRVDSSWIHVIDASEAAEAAITPSDGLVAVFQTASISCYRLETYSNASDAELSSKALAALEIVPRRAVDVPMGYLQYSDIDAIRSLTQYREHLPHWPSHKWWGGADVEAELGPCESHSADCRCNLPAELVCPGPGSCVLEHEHRVWRRCCGAACKTLRLASCEVIVTARGDGGYDASLSLFLEAAAFDLDRRLAVGPARADFSSDSAEAAFQLASVGERPVSVRPSRRALLTTIRRLVADREAGLACAAECCIETLNGYCGVCADECVDASEDDDAAHAAFAVPAMLASISKRGAANELTGGAYKATDDGDEGSAPPQRDVRLRTKLHPYQLRGVEWMAAHEEARRAQTLHPAWWHLVGPDGQPFFFHSYTGEASMRRFVTPSSDTCGGMLCDEVGLGKSLQVLALVLARPPPDGWASVPPLPRMTTAVLPIRATLIVAPAALLPQWRSEVTKHTVEGALTVATYVGLAQAPPEPVAETPAEAEADASGPRPKRVRKEVSRYVPVADRRAVASASRDATTTQQEEAVPVPVLAATRMGLFERDGEAVAVESCDVVFCSFETLRDELKTQLKGRSRQSSSAGDLAPHATMSGSPLGVLGFWRIVLDEAQIVSNTASHAAMMASALWRRHAWVVTGTPVNARLSELQGLLAFLGARPFADVHAFNALVHQGYERRLDGARPRMRALLSAHMLRRSKADPAVARQLRLPPVEWQTLELRLSEPERAACDAALSDLCASYLTFARASESTSNAREARRRLDEIRRRQGLDARDHPGGGAYSALHQARLLGELNGALTRVRQMLCSPSAVNAHSGKGARGEAAVLASAIRLPQRTILERLVAQASRDCDAAAINHLKVRAALCVATRALSEPTPEGCRDPSNCAADGGGGSIVSPKHASEAPVDAPKPSRPKAQRKRKAPWFGPEESGDAGTGHSSSVTADAAARAPSGGRTGEDCQRASDLESRCGEAAVMAELECLVTRSKERCAAASSDEVVQRLLEVRRQCSKCGRVAADGKSGGAKPSLAEKEGCGGAASAPCEGEGAPVGSHEHGPSDDSGPDNGGGPIAADGAAQPTSTAVHDGAAHVGDCSKGGAHAFRIVAGRKWAAVRATLRKLYLGKTAPWDAEDEREAKAAAAAAARRDVQDEDGRSVHSRRQSKKEAQSAAAAAASSAAAKVAPPGWERPAKRHPALCAIFTWYANHGSEKALEEGQRVVDAAARAVREKTSNLSFLQAKLDRYDANEAVRSGLHTGSERADSESSLAAGPMGETESAAVEALAAFEAESCPICFDERSEHSTWVVTPCGHAGCYECIIGWVEERRTCPVCKQRDLAPQNLFEVEQPPPALPAGPSTSGDASMSVVDGGAAAPSTVASDGAGAPVVGTTVSSGLSVSTASAAPAPNSTTASESATAAPSLQATDLDDAIVREYGTKIAALVSVVRRCVARGEKLVVFSAWTRLLHVAAQALNAQALSSASLIGSSADKRDALRRFGAVADEATSGLAVPSEAPVLEHKALEADSVGATTSCDVLLVPLFGGASGAGGSGAAGLNLQVASVAVLLEPQLQSGIEQQAVGRISRIGQQRPSRCVRLIIADSIEHNIMQYQQLRLAQGASATVGRVALGLPDFAHVLGQQRIRRASVAQGQGSTA